MVEVEVDGGVRSNWSSCSAAVDRDGGAGDISSQRGGQEGNEGCELLGPADPAYGDAAGAFGEQLFFAYSRAAL